MADLAVAKGARNCGFEEEKQDCRMPDTERSSRQEELGRTRIKAVEGYPSTDVLLSLRNGRPRTYL